jgi:hypothetical protein
MSAYGLSRCALAQVMSAFEGKAVMLVHQNQGTVLRTGRYFRAARERRLAFTLLRSGASGRVSPGVLGTVVSRC